MFDKVIAIDTTVFLFLNGKHNAIFDIIMWQISGKLIWVPLYLLLFFLLYKKTGGKVFIWAFVTVIFAVALTDFISVHAFKNVFERLRPTHTPEIRHLVHTVNNYKGGLYGFVSSHASNSFAIAVMFSLFLQNKYISFALIIWAGMVAYSRIYLGVHFPADVICGGFLGGLIAFFVYILFRYLWRAKASISPK